MSTYSPDLRIELISTGDQAGTWGNTTNTNLGTVIEDAISGYVSVSVVSANQALSALNGAADEARNAMIRLTTTTGANFAVYAPPSSKQYIIWNNSGYTATIYNSTVLGNTTAAGAGVTIANGDKVVVFTNGTNFYEVKTNNVTGTVAIANGGTGQTTANAAFNALAPSQASANGKYLKSDGTNTSWDAIDISTSDVSGVLAVVNGGTGASTASGARTNLGLGDMAVQNANAVAITGGSITGITDLAVADGGTGASTAAGARTNLGLGDMAVQNANAVSITGGSITGITDLAVADGGTGASTAAGARTNLGLVIGTDIPSPTGTGASGTWNINISGNAATANSATTATTATNATNATNATFATTAGNGGVTSVNSATGAVNLASLAAFARSLPTSSFASGYQTLPGGLIVQWGYSPTWSSVTFPLAFPNYVYCVVGTPTTNQEFFIGGVLLTGFSPGTNGNTSPFYWVAFGS